MKASGLWVSPSEFVRFAEKKDPSAIATRSSINQVFGPGLSLPNPDQVLKRLNKGVSAYRELLDDAHVGGCVRRRKAAVKTLEWGFDRGQARTRTAKLVADVFARLDLNKIIDEILDAALYGYQPLEVMWGAVDGQWLPVDIVAKPADWFVFDSENKLRLRTLEKPEGEQLPERKFLLARQGATYDNPYGRADLAMCFWPVTFKKGGLKFWVQFTEKYGMPWIIGKQPRSATNEETEQLLDQLDGMVQDAVAVVPDDSSVEILEAAGKTGSAEVYERLLHYCRGDIAIALLGQNQTTEAAANKASAMAGLEVTRDIRDGDKGIVESVINTLIRWIADWNFGDAEMPVFSMWEQEEVDEVMARRDEALMRAGASFTRSYFIRAYGLIDSDLAATPDLTGPDVGVRFAEAAPGAYEDTAAAMLAQDAQPVLDQWLGRIRQRLATSDDLQSFQDALLAEFSELDESALSDVMALGLACANLAGRSEVGNA